MCEKVISTLRSFTGFLKYTVHLCRYKRVQPFLHKYYHSHIFLLNIIYIISFFAHTYYISIIVHSLSCILHIFTFFVIVLLCVPLQIALQGQFKVF